MTENNKMSDRINSAGHWIDVFALPLAATGINALNLSNAAEGISWFIGIATAALIAFLTYWRVIIARNKARKQEIENQILELELIEKQKSINKESE